MKIILFALILCTVSAWVTYLPKDIDNKPPWCEICIDLAKKLKEALNGGEELKEVAHKFCNEKIPLLLIEACHKNVDNYWEKVIESLEVSFEQKNYFISI
ncbi:unnamed protein product [Cylicostephanus goldi]|uniref:Saposin B-type domain-containing protein n=1 Tax=Cylicostephanus goldi TaxID=71465 RepID=A0A3P7N7P4_CYLGO|nr:unnamed protein product [Cylicostephanus goldi]